MLQKAALLQLAVRVGLGCVSFTSAFVPCAAPASFVGTPPLCLGVALRRPAPCTSANQAGTPGSASILMHSPSRFHPQPMHAGFKTESFGGGFTAHSDDDGVHVWRCLVDAPAELRLGVTLVCGQSFRWRATGESEWTGVIADQLVTLREDARSVYMTVWKEIEPPAFVSEVKREPGTETEKGVKVELAGGSSEEGSLALAKVRPDDALLESARAYFGLSTQLAPLYQLWGDADPLWAQLATRFPGLRVLRQDPVECLFCFICSSNNNIARIALMVDRLSQRYGTFLGSHGGFSFYSFPSIEALAAADEDDLRSLGTGYRAKFIMQSAARVLENGGRGWLEQLRAAETTHVEARDALITLHGVGLKVADCVCLFALDKTGAIPVDTHVWQITLREMDATLSQAKSLTPTIYDQVGRLWRDRYGEYAGWAHTILFAADLTKFKKLRSEALGEDAASASPPPTKKRKSPSKTTTQAPTHAQPEVEPPAGVATKRRKSPSKASLRAGGERGEVELKQGEKKGREEVGELFEALYGKDVQRSDSELGRASAASPLFKPTPRSGSKRGGSGSGRGIRKQKALEAKMQDDEGGKSPEEETAPYVRAGQLKPRQLSMHVSNEPDTARGSAATQVGGELARPAKASSASAESATTVLPKIPRKKGF